MGQIITDLGEPIPWVAAKGYNNAFTLTLTNGGSAFNTASYTFVVNIRKIGASTNTLQLTQGSGITNGGATGIISIQLTAAQTTALSGDSYFYEVAYTISSLSYRLIQGSLILNTQFNSQSSDASLNVAVNLAGTDVNLNVTLGGGGSGGSGTLQEVLTLGNDGGGLQIKNIADPTLAQDAATKDYVDNKTSLTDFDASGGTFPSGALRGAEYQVTVEGLLGGEYVPIGSILKARQNAPTNDWLITGWKLI